MLDVASRHHRPPTAHNTLTHGARISTLHPQPNTGGSPPSPNTRPSIWSRLRLATWRGRFAWAGATLLILLIASWTLARMAPPWYQPLDPRNEGVIDTSGRAEQLLHFELRNTVERVVMGTQTWSITQDQLNSYLAIDVARALGASDDGKSAPASDFYVVFSPGELRVCARSTRIPGGGKAGAIATLVYSIKIIPGPDGQPQGLVKLTGAWVGCLPVPKSLVASRLSALTPAAVAAVQQAIELRMGVRDEEQWGPVAEEIIRDASAGKPFPLHYHILHKDLVIKSLDLGKGKFTLVLAPPPPAGPLPPRVAVP